MGKQADKHHVELSYKWNINLTMGTNPHSSSVELWHMTQNILPWSSLFISDFKCSSKENKLDKRYCEKIAHLARWSQKSKLAVSLHLTKKYKLALVSVQLYHLKKNYFSAVVSFHWRTSATWYSFWQMECASSFLKLSWDWTVPHIVKLWSGQLSSTHTQPQLPRLCCGCLVMVVF